MNPRVINKTLETRAAWLRVKIEGEATVSRPMNHQRAELAALDAVLAMLAPMLGQRAPDAYVPDPIVRAKEAVAAQAQRCSCHRCPLHGKATPNGADQTQSVDKVNAAE
jgi:hypothetical protein